MDIKKNIILTVIKKSIGHLVVNITKISCNKLLYTITQLSHNSDLIQELKKIHIPVGIGDILHL